MGKMVGAVAGVLLLIIVVIFYIPIISLDTKIVWMTYLWLPLVLLTGGGAVMLLPNLIIKLVIGVLTFAIIGWMIKYIPEILAGLLVG